MLMRMRKNMKNQKGFTLVELLVVIAILGILAAIAVPRFANASDSARGARIAADLRTIDSAIALTVAQGGVVTAGALLTADGNAAVRANLGSVPVAPVGNYTGPNHAASTAVPAGGYAINTVNGAPRAVIGGVEAVLTAEGI